MKQRLQKIVNSDHCVVIETDCSYGREIALPAIVAFEKLFNGN